MEITITSTEIIKPSSPVQNLKPYKLSLFDQLESPIYVPFIFFYPIDGVDFSTTELKLSLSKTLNDFYPLSGRLQNNNSVSDYNHGVPFIETRATGRLLDFLQHPQLELLNRFLPKEPFCVQSKPLELPQLAVQINVFECGGVGIGLTFLHKTCDGAAMSYFLKAWAANTANNGSNYQQKVPDLSEGSSALPPLEDLPMKETGDGFWYRMSDHSTRRFVFSPKAIADLQATAKSDAVTNPSRVQAVSAFIWKSIIRATNNKTTPNSPKKYICIQAINLRGGTKLPISERAWGNNYWISTTKLVEEEALELPELVALMKEDVTKARDMEFPVNGNEGSTAMIRQHLKNVANIKNINPEVFLVSSWSNLGFDDIDFGWGTPVWVGLAGKPSRSRPIPANSTIIKDVGSNTALEAWITFEEETIDILENDAEFLAFASPNPSIV